MSDDFSARYRLLKCVMVDDGIRTHNAQQVSTGKVVMVHINDAAGPDEVAALRAQLALLPVGSKHKVLETATLASGFAVVTEFLPGLSSFVEWLRQDAPSGANSTSSTSDAEPASTSVPRRPIIKVSFKGRSVTAPDASVGSGANPGTPPELRPVAPAAPAPVATPVAAELPASNSLQRPLAASPLTASPLAASPLIASPLAASLHAASPHAATPLDAPLPVAAGSPVPPAPVAPVSPPPLNAVLGVSALGADSFTGIFGKPVDPKSLDGGVEYVRSGQPAPAPISFALSPDIKFKTSAPMGEGGMPVPSAAAPASPPPPAAPPGEFTMMFSPSVSDAHALPSVDAPPPPSGTPSAPAPSRPTQTPTAFPAAAAPPLAPVHTPTPTPFPAVAASASSTIRPETTPVTPVAIRSPLGTPAAAMPAPATPVSAFPASAMPMLEMPALEIASDAQLMTPPPPQAPNVSAPKVAPVAPASGAASVPPLVNAAPPLPPAPSQFGWDTPAVTEAPTSKAPPGEFTMLFGTPETAAPLPEHMRASPMKEAPPPTFSPLTPERHLESPPVEPMHRVMSGNPAYGAGINQAGQSPIGNNLGMGGYAGGAQYPPSQQPGTNLNYGAAAYSSGQPYQNMPEFAPAPPPPAYPAAHASPLFAHEKQLAGEPNAMPGILPPPIFGNGGSTPLSALGGAAPRISANAGPSEYTQLIANGPAPVVPELKPKTGSVETVRPGRRRLPTGLIVVFNAVLLIAVFLLFFVFRQQVPNRQMLTPAKPVMPNMPTAPKIPVGPPR